MEKITFLLVKMTVTEPLKIIDNKIKANQARYDLDRLATKISAYSSGDLIWIFDRWGFGTQTKCSWTG